MLLSDSAEAPVLGPIQASDPVAVGEALNIDVAFTDIHASDTHTATLRLADGSAKEAGSVAGDEVTHSHVFTESGIYSARLEIVDSTELDTEVVREVVV